MNGWTPTIPLKTRLTNLIEQIPQEYRNDIVAQCVDENPHTTERNLSGVVLSKAWEMLDLHPVDMAQAVEREIDEELDGRTPEQDEHIKQHFGGVKITTSAEWRKRHL